MKGEELLSETIVVRTRRREDGDALRLPVAAATKEKQVTVVRSSNGGGYSLRLTDPTDSLFLLVLNLGEDEYRTLRVNQSLLVDFAALPRMMGRLVEDCRSNSTASGANLAGNGGGESAAELVEERGGGSYSLEFVQYSSFRKTTHLSLEFRQGSDDAVKRYLAGKWEEEKANRAAVEQRLAEQCRRTEAESSRANAADAARAKCERENADATRATDERHNTEIARMKSRMTELESSCSELGEAKSRLTADVRDLTNQLHAAKVDCMQREKELAAAKSELRASASQCGDLDRSLAAMTAQVAKLKDQLRAAEERAASQAAALGEMEKLRAAANAGEERVQSLKREIRKGNTVIKEMQSRYIDCTEQLKSRDGELAEVKAALGALQIELNTARQRAADSEAEAKALRGEAEALRAKIESQRVDAERADMRIDFLSRQLTNAHLSNAPQQQQQQQPPTQPSPPAATQQQHVQATATVSGIPAPRKPTAGRTQRQTDVNAL